jgi:hypothetical protein
MTWTPRVSDRSKAHRLDYSLFQQGRMWRLIPANTSDGIKKSLHAYSVMRSAGFLTTVALNQDCTAIYHNGLPSAESFLHQKQIGLRDLMSFADSANRETLSHAFV